LKKFAWEHQNKQVSSCNFRGISILWIQQ